jgi:Trypsin-like peptidase domain
MAEPWRVAQIAVDRGPAGADGRGSGYLVAPGRVLTAAHVVAGARVVRVRLGVSADTEVEVQADRWWADRRAEYGTDLAVVSIPLEVTAGRECEPAVFGRISDCAAVLPVETFGFPLFKLRVGPTGVSETGLFRDLEQVSGHAPVAANRRQGTLAIYLDDPPPGPGPGGGSSPWEGMSGSAVWAAGRIVGVVAEHHPAEGTGRLTVRRIDRAYDQLPAPDLGILIGMLGLPPAAAGLADVVPADRRQVVRSAYLAQVRDIAPDVLIGREGELAQWADFCAGTASYGWWQAGPWAGKTALASWFVTHPPAGVDIVSFFITGHLAGQADSDAFLDAMIEQLAVFDAARSASPATAGARPGTWLSLLGVAAAWSAERGRRLVVVVDGLDEDDAGATPARGKPSIASLLPRRPPPGVRFIITSRPDPGLPDDLPSRHLLRACRPSRLPTSPVARDAELLAKQELRDLLSGDQVGVDTVGFIAGAGGGLTRSDLTALTGAPPHQLDRVLRGVSGRSLHTRA